MFYIPQTNIKKYAELHIYRVSGLEGAGIEVNGHMLNHTCAGDTARGWRKQIVPGELLKEGRNEFIFSGNGVIVADTGSSAENSRVTYDGGDNWHPAEGEFIIRLRIRGYPKQGTVTSKIVDTALALNNEHEIGPHAEARKVRIDVEAELPGGTGVEIYRREGDTPWFDAAWTEWKRSDGIDDLSSRYFQ